MKRKQKISLVMNTLSLLSTLVFMMLNCRFLRALTGKSKLIRFRTSQCLANKLQDGRGLPKGSRDELRRYKLEYQQLSGLPDLSRPFKVLGIESSCDDTGVAVVSSDGQILSNVVYSQYAIHQNFGGVVPGLAMEAHKKHIHVAIENALQSAGLESIHEVDAIAVTQGPGLEICLRVGVRQAQELAKSYNKPLVCVHHLEAHCLVARLAGQVITSAALPSSSSATPRVGYPFLTLLASGGHTSILLCKGLGDYELLGGTLDDALGEALDKAARLLGVHKLGIPGGAAIEKMAKLYEEKYADDNSLAHTHSMTVPMRDKKGCDLSYAGLKNAFRQEVLKGRLQYGLDVDSMNTPPREMVPAADSEALPEPITCYLAHAFQDVAFQHIEDKLKRALTFIQQKEIGDGLGIQALVVVGGVASNMELRRRLLALLGRLYPPTSLQAAPPLVFPPPSLCTDNGVMVAWAGVEKLGKGVSDAIDGLEAKPKWPMGVPVVM